MQVSQREVRKSSLSSWQARLVEMIHHIGFGCIEGLIIRGGKPIFDPPPRIIREIKFGGENGASTEGARKDYVLKAEVVELLHYIESLGTGVILRLEIKHGLPFRMTFEEGAA